MHAWKMEDLFSDFSTCMSALFVFYIMVIIVWKVLLVTYVAKRSRWSAQQGKRSILPLNTDKGVGLKILDEYH